MIYPLRFALSRRNAVRASFTKVVKWTDIGKVSCDDTTNRLKVKDLMDIPMGFRCVKDAICEYPPTEINKIQDSTCPASECSNIKADDERLTCEGGDDHENMEILHNGKWMLQKPIGCYNEVLVDENIAKIPQFLPNSLRCRVIKKDMLKYFIPDSQECKDVAGVERKCKLPVLTPGGTTYDCSQYAKADKLTWDFEGKLEGQQQKFTKITSAEFRKNVFVMKEKTSGIESPYIPIEFRCIRDATCEADENNLFEYDKAKDCPESPPHKDDCKKPIYEKPDQKKIVCEGNMVLEYQSDDGKPWMQLTEIGCIGKKMAAKNAAGDVAQTLLKRIRCREPRTCDMAKYYDNDKCGGEAAGKRPLCIIPEPLSPRQCSTDYDLQFKLLKKDSWKKIDKIACDRNRFWLVDNPDVKREEIPISFRCSLDRKCNLIYYYEKGDCNTYTEICAMPVPNSNDELSCGEDNMVLRVKSDAEYEVVKSIKCKNNKFEVINKQDQPFGKFPHRIQCIKMRSTTCKNPTPDSPNVLFKPAETWDGITTLQCNPSEKLIMGKVKEWNMHTHLGFQCLGTQEKRSDAVNEPEEEWAPGQTVDELDELRKRKGPTPKACQYDEERTKEHPNLLTTTCMKAAGLMCENRKCEPTICETCIKTGNQTNAIVIGCDASKDMMMVNTKIDKAKVPYDNATARFVCEHGIWETETGTHIDDFFVTIHCVECAKICDNCINVVNMRNAIRCDDATQQAKVRVDDSKSETHTNETFVCKYGQWYAMKTDTPLVGDKDLKMECVAKSQEQGGSNGLWTWLSVVIAIIVISLIAGVVVAVIFRRKKRPDPVVPEPPTKGKDYIYIHVRDPITGLDKQIRKNLITGKETVVNEECIAGDRFVDKGPVVCGGFTNHLPEDHAMAGQKDGDKIKQVTIDGPMEAMFIGESVEIKMEDSIDLSEVENAPNLNEEEEKEYNAKEAQHFALLERLHKLTNIEVPSSADKEEEAVVRAEIAKITADREILQTKKRRYRLSALDRNAELLEAEAARKNGSKSKKESSPSSGGSSGNKKKETSKKRK